MPRDEFAGPLTPSATYETTCTYPYLGSHCPECRQALIRITTGCPWSQVAELLTLVFDHNATEADIVRMRETLDEPAVR